MAVSTIDPNGLNIGQIGGTRNKIINGAMVIDQRNAGAAVTASGSFPVDRFIAINNTNGAFSAQRVAEAPAGFVNSTKITTTTADATLTTTENMLLTCRVEGFNVSDLGWGAVGAKTITVSFWVRSSLTGTFGGSIRNNGSTRSYPFTYSVSAADTWEYKTVTIAGDTSGTWLTDNGIGLILTFGLGAGPDRSGTPGAWNSNNNISAPGAVSLVGTLNATWQITGVQLEAGDTATPFEHRSYGQELALCQRYYLHVNGNGNQRMAVSGNYTGNTAFPTLYFPTVMRAAPTLTTSAANTFKTEQLNGGTQTLTSIGADSSGPDRYTLGLTVGSSLTYPINLLANGVPCFLGFSAEL